MHYQMRSYMWEHFDLMRSCMWKHLVNQNFICMLICVVNFSLMKAEDGETGRPTSSCSSVKCASACWTFTPRFPLPPSFGDPHTVCLGQDRAICFKENKPVVKVLSVLGLEDRVTQRYSRQGDLEQHCEMHLVMVILGLPRSRAEEPLGQ